MIKDNSYSMKLVYINLSSPFTWWHLCYMIHYILFVYSILTYIPIYNRWGIKKDVGYTTDKKRNLVSTTRKLSLAAEWTFKQTVTEMNIIMINAKKKFKVS